MEAPTDKSGLAPAGPRGSGIARAWGMVVEGFAAVGTVLIVILMAVICADIVARNLMGSSLPLISEGGALLLVMIVALQLAAAIRGRRMARTDILLAPLEVAAPRVAAGLVALFDLMGAALLGIIAWATLRVVGKDWSAGEFIGVTGIATLQTWPFRAMILAGFAVAAVECLVRLVADLRRVGGRGGAGGEG